MPCGFYEYDLIIFATMNIRCGFILAACFAAMSTSAQFNTVARYRSLYSVCVADNEKTGKGVYEQKMVPSLVETDTIGKRKEWIDRYMSVSYPLRNIEVTSGYGNRTDPFTGKNHVIMELTCGQYMARRHMQ